MADSYDCIVIGSGPGGYVAAIRAAQVGFEALLGVSILIAALSLTVASNWQAVVLCLGTIAIAGPLFYKLVRAMARIQMPSRRPPP